MAKRILTLCLALAIGIAFAMPAAAAVKSIKVGGDLTIRGIYRDNLDFNKAQDHANSWLMSTTRIFVGAELTDNVSAVVRLLNERDWGNIAASSSSSEGTAVDLDLAYIKMKDLFIPGFTATLGRQEIMLGKGLLVGNRNNQWVTGALRAEDMSAKKAFDAWRLDYEVGTAPVTITLFDAKISETAGAGNIDTSANQDVDLWGLNVGYKTDNLKIEGYVLLLDQQTGDYTNMFTYGARVDHNVAAVPGLNYNLEAALQNGKAYGVDDLEGWIGNGDVSYTFQNPMQPKIGAAWYYASGDVDSPATGQWVQLYQDNVSDRIGRILWDADYGFDRNISSPKVYASIKPSEKHMFSLAYFPATTRVAVAANHADEVGSEIDLGYAYQYTEDVSFGLCFDYAQGGKVIKHSVGETYFDDTAIEVIGTVAVSF